MASQTHRPCTGNVALLEEMRLNSSLTLTREVKRIMVPRLTSLYLNDLKNQPINHIIVFYYAVLSLILYDTLIVNVSNGKCYVAWFVKNIVPSCGV